MGSYKKLVFFSHYYFSWMKWKAIPRECLVKKLSENFLAKPVEPVSEKIIIGSFFIGILSFASFLIDPSLMLYPVIFIMANIEMSRVVKERKERERREEKNLNRKNVNQDILEFNLC